MTGTIFLGAKEFSVGETDGTVVIPIVRIGDLSGAVTVEFGITGDTATSGVDYRYTGPTSVTMDPGEDRVSIEVEIIDDDAFEDTETFALSIIDIDSGFLFAPRTAQIDILDDENPVVDPSVPPLVSDYIVTEDAVVTGLSQPIAMQFAPQDPSLVYIAEKGGIIKVYDFDSDTVLAAPFIDIGDKVNNYQDRGLMDIEIHPDFGPSNPYLYAFYVVDPSDTAGKSGNAGPNGGGNRYSYVVRFEADAATNFTTAIEGSETILLGGAGDSLLDISGEGAILSSSSEDFNNLANSERYVDGDGTDIFVNGYKQNYLKVDSSTHAGGALEFGPDGALYVSVGDGAAFNFADPRAPSVQDLDSLSGKILRIDPMTGDGLTDNPFVQTGDDLSLNEAKVYQLGLRNPFTMTFDEDDRLFISETGWFRWEEINTGGPGANFGWPWYEGGDNGVLITTPFYDRPADYPEGVAFYDAVEAGTIEIATAFRAFAHADAEPGFQVQGIVGTNSIYTGSVYPPDLENSYFFTDVSEGEVYAVNINDRRDVKFLYQTDTGFGPVHFNLGPDGHMYYADLLTGEVGRYLIDLRPIVERGDASYDSASDEFTLTPDAASQLGAAMATGRLDLSFDFDITFDVFLGTKNTGADGAAFVLHNSALSIDAIGVPGLGLGTAGIENGLAVEFDTYDNGAAAGDIANDHTNFLDTDKTGTDKTITSAFDLGNIEDGNWHDVRVTWDASANTLAYSFDGQQVGSLNGDIGAQYLGGEDFAYFGFTGSTGNAFNLQKVRVNSVDAVFEGDNPPQVSVLSVSISSPSISENGGSSAATVTRNTGTTGDLVVQLGSSDTGEATVPATVTILDGTASATFTVTGVDDTIVDGTQSVTVTASAAGFDNGTDTVNVTDDDGGGGTSFSFGPNTANFDHLWNAAGLLRTNGGAAIPGSDRLILTQEQANQAGSTFYTTPLTIEADTSFQTEFRFRLDGNPSDSRSGPAGADGFAFVIQGVGLTALGDRGGSMGYGGEDASDPRGPILNSLAIEFDSYRSTWDLNANHIGVLVNGNVTDHKAQATNGAPGFGAGIDWNDGDDYWAWVEYSGTNGLLEVFVSESATQPVNPALTYNITTLAGVDDLTDIVGTQAYAGFTAGTGFRYNGHEIEEWEMTTSTSSPSASLAVSINAASISENGGSTTATVMRDTGTSGSLTVNLTSSDTGEAVVPATVTIPNGQNSATFTVTGVDDTVVDGTQTVTITASAAGFTNGADTVNVTDDDSGGGGGTSFSFGPNTANFDHLWNAAGLLRTNGGAAIPGPDALSLTQEQANQAGSTFYTTPLTIEADTSFQTEFKFRLDGNPSDSRSGPAGADGFAFVIQGVGLTALGDRGGSMGYGGEDASDPHGPILNSLAIEFDSYRSTWDLNANHIGVLVNGNVTDHKAQATNGAPGFGAGIDWNDGDDYWAWVEYSGTNGLLEVFVSESATQPVNPALTYNITTLAGVDDLTDIVGTQAYAGFTAGTGFKYNGHEIEEWEMTTSTSSPSASLAVSINAASISENGGSSAATVTRGGGTAGDLIVNLASNDTTEATVPATVTIPNGQNSATFTVTGVDDTVVDGTQTVTITASAAGFDNGTDTVNVTDDDSGGGGGTSFSFGPNTANFDHLWNEAGLLQTNGDATIPGSSRLSLTEDTAFDSGSTFYTTPLTVDADSSFQTWFKFRLDGDPSDSRSGPTGADGFAFVIQGAGPAALGDGGGSLGYGGQDATDPHGPILSSLAIEFDSYRSTWDLNANHVAVLVNGDVTDHKAQATNGAPGFGAGIDWNDGDDYWAWVEYNGTSGLLEVFVSETATRPDDPVLTYDITTLAGVDDLTDIVGTEAHAGFTAGTGFRYNTHEIQEWEMSILI